MTDAVKNDSFLKMVIKLNCLCVWLKCDHIKDVYLCVALVSNFQPCLEGGPIGCIVPVLISPTLVSSLLCRVLSDINMSDFTSVRDFCQGMYDKDIRSPYLLGFMVEMQEEQLEGGNGEESVLLKATEVRKEWEGVISSLELRTSHRG